MHTITIDDETFEQIRVNARARHVSLEEWLRSTVHEASRIQPPVQKKASELTPQERLARMAAFEAKLVPLNPNADFSREAIYD
jgi:hypothetical protein